ncbi:uncharacterized protein KIAA1522 homolog [Mastacembelus armatus]|uniref:KIAA1522 n=1 Tax=Mastacembelus armatus TaxID=205130 RepID=A0A3Q3LEV8_9TELE|nr:uncharacterized protein KIAA1522 homolog [Mastacembelus armatus]XP_026160788.1 uncharacterized protein KIAA1522 homolog [Mastacembelus armatus]
MSNRDSLGVGELLPQDVVDIFSQEKHSKRGRKKRSHSLGRALSWLKGKKRKDVGANGQRLGLGPALDLALDGHLVAHQGHKGGQKAGRQANPNSHAVLKRNDDDKTPAPPLLQENVFIETNRPKYLEDLHTEALEGLKMMQQEETNNGVEYQDNESTISTMTVQTDGEGGGFMTDSTIPDTSSVVSVQSSVSTKSSRSGLTRQGSTFRPLNSGKKSENTRMRRNRKTVGGIPQHVQRELGLDRVGWMQTQRFDEEQLYNGRTDDIPAAVRPQKTVHSQNVIQPLNKDQVEQLGATHAGHRDDLALLHCLGPDVSDGQRPLSLAVPWMTTANSGQQEPPNPVMSMSPQAAYMSKIIPNAVLPSSIEVVEISRGRSRSSLRTVSKSSLLLSSPAPSRASSRASSSRTTSSKATSSRTTSSKTSTLISATRHNNPNLSDSSCWSNSESSETLVSDSSTISSSSTPRQMKSRDRDGSAKEDKVSAHSFISKASQCTSNGKFFGKSGEVKQEGQFVRSLSVVKPKKAPPPPSRSYSLHSKMKRRSRDLAEVKVVSGESSLHSVSSSGKKSEKNKPESSTMHSRIVDSPGYNADTSSLDESISSVSFSPIKSQLQGLKTEGMGTADASQEKQGPPQENKLSKIISPSSGYSSQDATSPQLSKPPHSSSPRHKKGILAKLQRFFPGSVPASALVAQPEGPKSTGNPKPVSFDIVGVNPPVWTLRDLFNIPPPPKVHAPPPPPPEVWAHSKRTFELLLGPPAPENVYAIINYPLRKNPKDRRQQRQSLSASTEDSVKSLVAERKHKAATVTVESVNGSLHVSQTKKVQESEILNAENNERLTQSVELKGNSNVTVKEEKVRVSDLLNGMILKAVEKREERLTAKREDAKKMYTPAAEVKTISSPHISSSPSPPAAHHPPQLLPRQTTEVTSVTSVQAVVSPESSWPPPPPMAQVGSDGLNEVDFSLHPVPLRIPVQVPIERSAPSGDSSCIITSVAEAEPQKSGSAQGITPAPLSIPPPPSYTAPPPPVKAVSPPETKKAFLPQEESCLPPPEEFFVPPPKEFCAAPSTEISPVRPKDSCLLVQKVSPIQVTVVSSTPVTEASPLPPKESSTHSTEVVTMSFSQDVSKSSVETTVVSNLTPPLSIPPPPPLPSQPQLSEQGTKLPQKNIPTKSETNPVSCNSVLGPPPIEFLRQPQVVPPTSDSPATQEIPPSVSIPPVPETSPLSEKAGEPAPPCPTLNIPVPPPLPVQGLASSKHQPSPASTDNQSQKLSSSPVVQEEPTPIVTPSLLQMVKLRSINSSRQHPRVQEPLQAAVTMRKQQPSNQVSMTSASGEAPQKPIRKSLIVTSPTSTSAPVTIISQPAPPKFQLLVVPPASSSTAASPTKKSPPAMASSPSMNLQEAIRLRTAARSKESPASRLSFHAPTSPIDPLKSPSSTASFIFSKSNRKVETNPASEAKTTIQKNTEVSFVTKVLSEAESLKMGVKVPPPVAKKPKTKGTENENSEETEQTAGQEGPQESNEDAAETTNGTGGAAEGGETSST